MYYSETVTLCETIVIKTWEGCLIVSVWLFDCWAILFSNRVAKDESKTK